MNALRLSNDEPLVRSLVEAIHAGRIETVKALVLAHPGLACWPRWQTRGPGASPAPHTLGSSPPAYLVVSSGGGGEP